MKIRIACIECGTIKEAEVGAGRPRYFCSDRCRYDCHRKIVADASVGKDYDAKRRIIDGQYREARKSTRSLSTLRRRAMGDLIGGGWAVGTVAQLFDVSEQRVREIVKRKEA